MRLCPRSPLAPLLAALALSGGERPPAGPPPAAPAKVEAPGLHNVYRLTPGLYSGSSPEGDTGFRSLRRLGIHTVLSVDGARPDLERARRHGLRYVHLPVGYDGVPRAPPPAGPPPAREPPPPPRPALPPPPRRLRRRPPPAGAAHPPARPRPAGAGLPALPPRQAPGAGRGRRGPPLPGRAVRRG